MQEKIDNEGIAILVLEDIKSAIRHFNYRRDEIKIGLPEYIEVNGERFEIDQLT